LARGHLSGQFISAQRRFATRQTDHGRISRCGHGIVILICGNAREERVVLAV